MSISITIGEETPKDLAGKVAAWESIADKHLAAGGARVMRGSAVLSASTDPSKPATKPAPRAVVASGSSILYKGVPMTDGNAGHFLSNMFGRVYAEQRRAGKSFNQANDIARGECHKWREANLQGGHLRASSGGS